MKKSTFNWRYLALFVMLFSMVSVTYAESNKITGDNTGNSTIAPPGARLNITPETLDLGNWPIGGWQEGLPFTLSNDGVGAINVLASDMEDMDGVFAYETLAYPINLDEGETVDVGISFTGSGVAAGTYTATYVTSWGEDRAVTTGDITVNAYVPAEDDIVETASIIELPAVVSPVQFSSPSTREYDGLYKNYILPQDVAAGDHDFVYEIVATADVFFNVLTTSGINTNMALYAADFGGEEGPMADNALVQGFTSIVDFPMFTGSYYLVISAEGASTGNITGTIMTNPAMVVNQLPIDGEVDVVNGEDLEWIYGGTDALEYQVVIGTTYPPVDVVVEWTPTSPVGDTYELVGLDANLQYFWRVNVRNNIGSTDGDIWGFTTTLTPALDVVAVSEDLFMGDDVVLNWASPVGGVRALLGYNIYRDDVMINADLVTGLTFTDDTELAYNMTGYTYNVTSVFDEGESEYSNNVIVTVSGEGSIIGTVVDDVTDIAIEGAAVEIEGVDEYGNDVTYSATTIANGTYDVDVKVGTYDILVSADGYLDGTATGVDVVYDVATTKDFDLAEIAYPLASVTATELDDDEVHLEWTFEESTRELVNFDIYRGLWYQVDIDNFTLVGSTTQNQFIDYDWGIQTSGVYRWAVVAVYTESESLPTFSEPLLDKDMETVVNVEVVLNTAESPAGTEVTLTNTSEVYLELEYTTTLDETGLFTFEDFRKGTYEVEVSLFGYTAQYEIVTVTEETDLEYLLVEILNPVTDLYVNPNGYATWGVPAAGGLDMFTADFEGGMPGDIEILGTGDGVWESTIFGYVGDGAISNWGYDIDTRMNTPKVTLDETTVVQFAWQSNYYWSITQDNADLTIDISFNGGLTWEPIWSFHDIGAWNTFVWYETTIDLASLGYTEGDAMFSAHVVADDNADIVFDEWYIGPADLPAGNIAISSVPSVDEQLRSTSNVSVEMLSNNLLTSSDANRSLTTFKVSIDDVFSGNTTDMFYDYEVEETLVEGTVYTAKVEADYTTGLSEPMEYTFTYHACDYYDVHAGVTAEVVLGTMDVLVSWTEVTSTITGDDIVAVNVFRDGELVATVDAGTASYTDAQLASGDYTYCITNLYESEAESCEVCADVTVTPGGYVNGIVTDFASGDGIEGAEVLMVATGDPYIFTTDADGNYSGEVAAGTYTYVVSATAYATETREDILVDFGTTVEQNFALLEFPYSVAEVIATEIDDNVVQLNWSGQGGGGGDGVDFDFEDNLMPEGMMLDAPEANWGVANGMMNIATSGAGVFRSSYYNQEFDNFVYEVAMQRNAGSEGGTMGIIVRADGFTTVTAGDGSNGLLFCVTTNGYYFTGTLTNGDLPDWSGWLTSSAINTGLSTANVITAEAQGTLVKFFINGTLVTTMTTTIESGYCGTFAHEGDVTAEVAWDYFTVTPEATAMNFDVAENAGLEGKGSFTECVTSFNSPGKFAKGVNVLPAPTATRALLGYNVYRGACGAEDEDMTFIGYTLDQQFTDNTWGAAEHGIYSWAIESVYDFNTSAFTYSNCLDKDMITTVSVEVTTNSADSPEGTDVVFTNVSEIADPEIVFEVELDDTGMHTWEDFRKGTYDIFVHKNGFADIMVEGVEIWEATDFTWVLEELLLPPSDLYVTPLGFATWGAGGVVPFEPVFENFDAGLPETWTIVDGGGSADTWAAVTDFSGNSIDGTPFMFVNSDAAGSVDMDELLVSPIIENTENADMVFIEFDHYLNNFLDDDLGEVQVFDGDEWVVVASYTTDEGSWSSPDHISIDVTEYANADFQVRFHYVANYGWYWGVDNFAVTEGADRYADRELEYFKVFHDYNFITDTDTTFYQYGDNGEVLVPGETYMAEVAAVYSTGMSAKMFYEWTYYPCDSFAGPAAFTAENVEDTKDVLLTWTDVLPAPENYSQDFEGGFPPEGWMKASPDGGTGWEAIATGTTPIPGWTGGEVTACPDGGAQMAFATWSTGGSSSNDQWLISPMLESFTDFEISFYLGSPYADSYVDQVDVLISTTGTDVSDFDVVVAEINLNAIDWVLYNYVVTDYVETGMPIYIAFREHVADNYNDGAVVLLDNFYYGAATDRAIPQITNVIAEGGRDVHYVHTPQIDVPYQELVLNREVEDVFVGANLYRDGIMIAEMVQDTFYLDTDLTPDFYDYCITYVYESGAESCEICVNDVPVFEDCVVPQNLTATLNAETYDDIFLAWNQATEVEYRYDDGVSTGQLGSSGGTTSTLLGNVHRVDAELSEMSWYLTAEGGPHSNISIWVLGLDASGIPDGNNVLFTSSVSNTDEQWNTFTFNEPLEVTGGFFLGVSYNGFAAIGTDDGSGDPYVFVPNTHYFVGDYTVGGWETWETYNFSNNGMIRATGMEAAVASYEVEPIESDGTSDFTLVKSPEATVTGEPTWTNQTASSNREFVGYNIYREGTMIVENHPENTYTDADGLVNGNIYCYTVTAVYEVCGETEHSNEACTEMYVGIPTNEVSNVSVYPNPATSLVNVTSSQEMTRISVINYVGQVVYQSELNNETTVQLNTSSFENGVYVVRLDTENGVVTKRVIIAQ